VSSASDLAGLVSVLRSFDPSEYGPETIGRLLADVRLTSANLAPYINFKESGYTRNLVFICDDFEVTVLCWSRNAMSAIHDHAGQHCWFTTLEGSFDVDEYRRLAGGHREGYARLEQTGTLRSVSVGAPDYRHGDNDIHRVAVSPGHERAISLHVYAKPLDSCLTFDNDTQRCMRRVLRYDTRPTRCLTVAGS
jgi:cysteine dioxygenase